MNGMLTVLIVDDDEISRLLLKSFVAGRYNVIEASNLLPALRLAHKYEPDVVILDLNLHDSTGLATLKTFLANAPECPVVIASGAIDDLGVQAIEAGASEVVSKPFTADEVIAAIARAIARQRCWEFRGPVETAFARMHDKLSESGEQQVIKETLPRSGASTLAIVGTLMLLLAAFVLGGEMRAGKRQHVRTETVLRMPADFDERLQQFRDKPTLAGVKYFETRPHGNRRLEVIEAMRAAATNTDPTVSRAAQVALIHWRANGVQADCGAD